MYILFGTLTVVFGTIVYWFLPLGLLKWDPGMVLSVLFMVLLGMLSGMTLFAINV